MDKKQVAEALEGYARASAFVESQRMERLVRLTPEEARAEFDELTEGWKALPDSGTRIVSSVLQSSHFV